LPAGKDAIFESAHQLVGLFCQTQGQNLEKESVKAKSESKRPTYGVRQDSGQMGKEALVDCKRTFGLDGAEQAIKRARV